MKPFLSALLAVIITTTLWSASVDSLEVGDEICVEGYVMDLYCILRGTLLDNRRVATLEGPEEHSVHCLVDVPSCYNSGFEILLDPTGNQTRYSRGWRLDEDGTQLVLDLARAEGRSGGCSTCSGSGVSKGFRAALNVTLLDLGSMDSPPLVSVQSAVASSPDEKVCGETAVDLSSTERPESGASGRSTLRILLTVGGLLSGSMLL